MDTTEKKRLTADEREALARISLAIEFLNVEAKFLERRSKAVHGAGYLAAAKGLMERYLKDVYRTVPREQLVVIQRSFKETTVEVGIKCSATRKVSLDKEFGLVIPMYAANKLMEASRDRCLMCGLNTEEQRKCELRKAIDMIPNNIEDREDGGCPYHWAV